MGEATERAARAYHEAGLCVIPIRTDGSKSPDVPAWKQFQARRPDSGHLTTWWGNGTERGIAVVWGAVSGNGEALDFDEVGLYEKFDALCREHGQAELLDSLPLVETPSGGRHLYWRGTAPVPGNQKIAQRQGEGGGIETLIETRGEGGYTIAPGSPPDCHPDRKQYRFLRGRPATIPTITPEQRSILVALATTFNEYVRPEAVRTAPGSRRAKGDGLRPGEDYSARGDYEALLERHGWRRLRGGDKGLWQRPGKTGPGISATSNYAGSGLFYVFSSNAAPFEPQETYSPFAVYTLIEHGGDYAVAARTLGKDGYGEQAAPAPKQRATEPEAGGEPNLARFEASDIGNGERLAARFGHKLRHSGKFGWMVYDGKRWQADETREAERCAKETVLGILEEALTETDDDRRMRLTKHAAASQANSRVKAMIDRAGAEAALQVRAEHLDADPFLLNVSNGSIDLRAGGFHSHRATDYLTKIAPVDYRPDASCPKWDAFLERILPDADTRGFVQRAVGYTLTGDTGAECLFFCYGGGANGKSTFIEALHGLLGDYFGKCRSDALMHRDGPQTGASSDLADLFGRRLVAVSELSQGQRLSEGLIKDITSRDTIKARHLYKELFEFNPTHKLWLCGNHKPNIKGTDAGIWRRIRLVPFTVQIPDTERNPNLLAELRGELPGILNWALSGCREYLRDGLGTCQQVQAATAAYRSEMDTLGAFLDECCACGDGFTASAKDLYDAYTRWGQASGERVWSQKAFGMALSERGHERRHARTGWQWRGVGLLAEEDGDTSADPFSEVV